MGENTATWDELDQALSSQNRSPKYIKNLVSQLPATPELINKLIDNDFLSSEIISVFRKKLSDAAALSLFAAQADPTDLESLIQHKIIEPEQVIQAFINAIKMKNYPAKQTLEKKTHEILSSYELEKWNTLIDGLPNDIRKEIAVLFEKEFINAASNANLSSINRLMKLWPNVLTWENDTQSTISRKETDLYSKALDILFKNIDNKSKQCMKTIAQNNPTHSGDYFAKKINEFSLNGGSIRNLFLYIHTNAAAEIALKKVAAEGSLEQLDELCVYLDKVASLGSEKTTFFATDLNTSVAQYPVLALMQLNQSKKHSTDATEQALIAVINAINTNTANPDFNAKQIKVLNKLLDKKPGQAFIVELLKDLTVRRLSPVKLYKSSLSPKNELVEPLAKSINILDMAFVTSMTDTAQRPQETDSEFQHRAKTNLLEKLATKQTPWVLFNTKENKQKLALSIIMDAMEIVISSLDTTRFPDKFLCSKNDKIELLRAIKNDFKSHINSASPAHLSDLAKIFSETAHIQRGLFNFSGGKKMDARSGILFDKLIGNSLAIIHPQTKKSIPEYKSDFRALHENEHNEPAPPKPKS